MYFLKLISESLYLTAKIAALLTRYLLDRICSRPLSLTLPVIGRFISGISSIKKITPKSEGGAGGNGTSRDWLAVEAGGAEVDVFAKTATANTVETFFLNLFDVYANELRFYSFIKGRDLNRNKLLPADFFPKVYAAEFSFFQSSFLLLIENVDKTRSSSTTSVSFPQLSPTVPHPLRRVLAVLETQALMHAEFFMAPPPCAWNRDSRPPMLQLVAQSTKNSATVRYADVLSPKILLEYGLFLEHYAVVRDHWDSGAVTLVHGDAHLGNYFFVEELEEGEIIKTTARMYDFQCTAHEHPIRDVAYHIICSVDEGVIDDYGGDKRLLQFYLDKFNANMGQREASSGRSSTEYLSFDEAWSQYRLHSFWVLAAFVISAGAGDLFDFDKAQFTIGRIVRGCERVNAGEELHRLLRESGHVSNV